MYSQLVDHLTVIHRVTINTMPHCHKNRRRVHSVRVRVYHLSPKAHRVPRVIPTARRLVCMCASCMFVVPASRSQPFIVYVVCCTRLTHVRCTHFTLSTVHCVRRLLYTPHSCALYPLHALNRSLCTSSAVHAAKRTIAGHRTLASSPKYGECNCSCRHTRQFAVTRVAAERTSIVIVHRRLYS